MSVVGPFEDQVLVEFPKRLANQIRQGIRSGSLEELKLTPMKKSVRDKDGNIRNFSIEFDLKAKHDNLNSSENDNNNTETRHHKYSCELQDLPCVIETQKTFNKNYYFKSGDISQMLVVNEDDDIDNLNLNSGNFKLDSGITPPANFIRNKWEKINEKFSVCRCFDDDKKYDNNGINTPKKPLTSQTKRLQKCDKCGKITVEFLRYLSLHKCLLS